MSWSYRLATVRGIDLKVHATFALIVAIAAANWAGLGLAGMAFGATLILLLFACVTLHEFGHALAAQYYGIPVKEIVLLPIGGIAFLGRPTRHPMQELVIAAAGPAVNVAIVAILLPLLYLLDEPFHLAPAFLHPQAEALTFGEALRWLVSANVSLVLFNMIPAFPLDGGRILRGALGLWFDWPRATRWATRTGQVLAVGMGAWGLLTGQLMLLVVAALIFFSASSTQIEERAHGVLSTRFVGDACNRHAIALNEHDRLSTVTRYLLTSYQPDFAVLRGNDLLGVVPRHLGERHEHRLVPLLPTEVTRRGHRAERHAVVAGVTADHLPPVGAALRHLVRTRESQCRVGALAAAAGEDHLVSLETVDVGP